MKQNKTVKVGLIGAGAIGSFHGESIARRVPGAQLAAIADPAAEAAQRLADRLHCASATTDVQQIITDPDIDAVIIAAPARFHSELIVMAAEAGKAVFCEKPMALTIEEADRAIAAARAAKVPLQVGFNRRYDNAWAEAQRSIVAGELGTPQLLRSLTRDPELADPARVPPWAIFLETLIHDFDTLRFFNPGSEVIEVYAIADALVRPDFKSRGLLDTALVSLRFDNGAMACAEANFQAAYGYDVRGEVFGSRGMVTMGDVRRSNAAYFGANGINSPTTQLNIDLFHDAYTAQLVEFVATVRSGEVQGPSGEAARAALALALACIRSVTEARPVRLAEVL
ncbi:Gfo/Idh/MocA family oxidoreductase [Collimonas silvisoli]|uniref:Gfo/Idh/MocA family oxidoreductase n=1 Tax=Collimonas silvisoli TaxID=2825884 RepID=UPI001B8CADA0|nr:Gfo/Idh/MocA family oxidoreductase [Collimonas silvisoli]